MQDLQMQIGLIFLFILGSRSGSERSELRNSRKSFSSSFPLTSARKDGVEIITEFL